MEFRASGLEIGVHDLQNPSATNCGGGGGGACLMQRFADPGAADVFGVLPFA